ncbi:MAG: amidohydrolase family protein, partial [Deltaproteobacteria bacterium]|nr:amidohydrolase family protein [Deltaproteobacteria bacterium]
MRAAEFKGPIFFAGFLLSFFLSLDQRLVAQPRPIAIVGGTLIDGTGRPPLPDAAVIIHEGRFREVGRRGDISIPQGAEVIEAKGKTILPGLVDGHCHYRDWMGEIYLALGVTTCPDISNNPTEWILAQREGIQKGTIRGPRVWATGNHVDGPPPSGTGRLRRQRGSIIVQTSDDARKAVRELVEKGVDGIKLFERLTPEVAKAAAEEAHRHGRPVFGHSLDIFAAADAGYQSVEHSWSVLYSSIRDPKKKAELDIARMTGKVNTAEVHVHMEPEMFDRIIKVMVEKRIHWSPTWGTWFRPLSPQAAEMKRREVALLRNPGLRYLPPYILKTTEQFFAMYEGASAERRAQLAEGYERVQDFVRRFVGAGGRLHSGSDPNNVLAGYGLHAEFQLLIDAGLSPPQVIQSASLNVALAWGKAKDYGSVETGKVADIVIVRGDPIRDISATQEVEMVFMDGKPVDISLNPDYRNPIPRPLPDRFVPTLSGLSPPSLTEGSTGRVKLSGSGFRPTHQALLSGRKVESRFINSKELEVHIPAVEAGT